MKHAPRGVLRSLASFAAQIRCRRGCRRTCGRAVVGVLLAGALAAAILGLGLHVNLSPSAPRGLYRAVAGTPTRGAWVAACVSPEAAALGRARGYLGAGPCIGGVQPVVKPVVALAGDVVELRPRLSTLADAVWGRHVVGADEFWL